MRMHRYCTPAIELDALNIGIGHYSQIWTASYWVQKGLGSTESLPFPSGSWLVAKSALADRIHMIDICNCWCSDIRSRADNGIASCISGRMHGDLQGAANSPPLRLAELMIL